MARAPAGAAVECGATETVPGVLKLLSLRSHRRNLYLWMRYVFSAGVAYAARIIEHRELGAKFFSGGSWSRRRRESSLRRYCTTVASL